MPDPVEFPKRLKKQGWKVKIFGKERLEPPHATLIHHARVWRIDLRARDFMDPPGGRWRDVDPDVREIIEANWDVLCDAWDEKYPSNPVRDEEDQGDDD
jgi:hypothetical protein